MERRMANVKSTMSGRIPEWRRNVTGLWLTCGLLVMALAFLVIHHLNSWWTHRRPYIQL